MADFLITARISTPDSLLEQAVKLAALRDPIKAFGDALAEVMGLATDVKLERVRAAKGSVAAADPAKPKRERKAKVAVAAGDAKQEVFGRLTGTGSPIDKHGNLLRENPVDTSAPDPDLRFG